MSNVWRDLGVFLLFVMAIVPARAQSLSGTISGSVVDPSGDSIAGAPVTLLNERTGQTRTATTNEVGAFTFFSVPPGSYTVTIERQGFQGFRRTSLALSANERLSLGAIPLNIGDVSEKVTVAAVGASVQTASSERAAQLTSSQVNMILVRGRDVLRLVCLLTRGRNTTNRDAQSENRSANYD